MTKDKLLRGQVEKHLPLFIGYMKQYGSEVVRNVLTKGRHNGFKLKVCLNKKDRYQMMQMLDLK